LQLVKDVGYDGYIGIEFEGDTLAEADGIWATKTLLETTWASLD
ncbi:MAG: sugar phosphate isomerase/epimerase, partial [Maribacter sp.]|nr:sugar phosphate isomerase/epimerase [Maribacter sp.]